MNSSVKRFLYISLQVFINTFTPVNQSSHKRIQSLNAKLTFTWFDFACGYFRPLAFWVTDCLPLFFKCHKLLSIDWSIFKTSNNSFNRQERNAPDDSYKLFIQRTRTECRLRCIETFHLCKFDHKWINNIRKIQLLFSMGECDWN